MFFYVYYFIYFVYHKVPSWLWRLDHKIQFIKHTLYSIIPELCLQFSCESLSISSHVQLHSFTVLISTNMLDFFSARSPSHTGDTISFRNLIKYQKENINIHICIPYFSASMNICPVIVINTNTGNINSSQYGFNLQFQHLFWPPVFISHPACEFIIPKLKTLYMQACLYVLINFFSVWIHALLLNC